MQSGRMLRWARLHVSLSQRELSRRTGVAQSTISKIEDGQVDPHFRTLRVLLRACGRDIELASARGYGVDRGALRQQLEMTPEQRLTRAATAAASAARWHGAARARGAPTSWNVSSDWSTPSFGPLDLDLLFGTLAEDGVRYILIGGTALNLLGVGLLTEDVDICYDASQRNVRALLRALRRLDAVTVDADLRPLGTFPEPRALQFGDNSLFLTRAGRLDCLRVPDGTAGFDDLIRTAQRFEVGGIPVVVPSPEDMRRMKLATNRPKDRIALEELAALLDVLDDMPPPANPA